MQQHGISKLDLKRQNRMQVLKILKQQGPTSRIDIAKILELTRAAVTIITNEMIAQGVIAEIGEYQHINEKAPRGRKKILIDINQNYKFVIGVLIDEDMISVGLCTLVGAVLDKRNTPQEFDADYDSIATFIKDSIASILSDNCLDINDILGIGFGIYPHMYNNIGAKFNENGDPSVEKLAVDIYDKFKVPLVFDNSVKGLAMAHIDFQPTKDINRHNIAFLRYGESLHFVVTNLNEPIVSYDNRTDFVDKIILNVNDKAGTTKSAISKEACLARFKAVYSKEQTPNLFEITNGDFKKVNIKTIDAAIEKGDTVLKSIYDDLIKIGAVLLNNLYFTTNPQKLVIHNLSEGGHIFEDLKREFALIVGDEIADKLDESIVEKKHGFLSGAAIAIRELFYIRGGYGINAAQFDEKV